MTLQKLIIQLQPSYAADAGKYTGVVEWEDKSETSMNVKLPPECSEKLLLYLVPLLQEHARRSADAMVTAIEFSVQEARQLPEITT